jgi:hypothetical protein
MDINKLKERDKLLIKEAGIKAIARLIGYNEIGEPVELVYNPRSNTYDWHVGGEYVNEASQQALVSFFPALCTIAS